MSDIVHQGKVISVSQNRVTVSFEKHQSCQGCKAKHSCSLMTQQNQEVGITVDNPQDYKAGQEVELLINAKAGFAAVFLAYILPLMLVLIVLFGVWLWQKDEALAALLSLLSLVPYYAALYALQGKLQSKMEIRLR